MAIRGSLGRCRAVIYPEDTLKHRANDATRLLGTALWRADRPPRCKTHATVINLVIRAVTW